MEYKISTNRPFFQPLLFVLGMLFLPALSQAQDCDLACVGTLESPLQTVLNDTCGIIVTTEMVVRDIDACPGAKLLTVRDSFSNLIAQGLEIAPFSGGNYINNTLSVSIIDQATGTTCIAFINIVDNSDPVITSCPSVTVNCLEGIDPDDVGYPTAEDNCDAELNFSYQDNFTARDCLTDTAGIVIRAWTISDDFGKEVSCNQRINILRASSMDVVFPADRNLDCDEPDADPSITGMPQVNGVVPMHGDLCGLSVGMEDDTIFICNTYMYRIERTWTVVEECTSFFDERMQVILVADNEGPVLNCPNSTALTYTSDSGDCGATIALPTITATDNCSSIINYSVTSSYGATGFSVISGVAPGIYTVQYQAVDECGNGSMCMTQVTVTDDVAPIAACDDHMIISVSSSGYALLGANAFDEGSSDNCASPVFFKAKRNDAAACDLANGDDSSLAGFQEWFDDRVVFCCTDISDSVMVTLRVYEVDPGNGPINPNREMENGDLFRHYTDCETVITLQDGGDPIFTSCPPSFTIECDDEQEILGIYGSPTIMDNCGFTLDSTFTRTVNDCGAGEIIRTWTATDFYNNSSQCSQIISIENQQFLEENDIVWPENYIFYECGANTSIENLPIASQEPIVDWGGCGQLAMNYTDVLFNIVPGACFKILRTWTVIDWCRFNTENLTGSEGRFTHVQEIKVLDNTNPIINCPPPVTVNISPNCQTAFVTLGFPTAEDCSTNITFTNDSPFANSGGKNARGNYPVGTTTVRFYANDNCTNNNACTTTVTVSDMEAPSISCIVGFTATLMPTPDGDAMASIIASSFIASGSDNCTETDFLKYTINRPADGTAIVPSATEIFFDCADANSTVNVQVWVTDLEGNSSYCTTEVNVQYNGNCAGQSPSVADGMIAGGVITENGQDVESIMISILGEDPEMMYTGIDGGFVFEELSLGDDYSITAENNTDILNGVTTYDLILIGKHILGTRLLDSPYKIIAADIDRSGHVSTLDIIKLRKLILYVTEALPNDNTSWRFVDASYVFPDPNNPFLGYFPEIYNVNDLNGSEMHADFIGIKVGDVNGSVIANRFGGSPDDRSSSLSLVLEVPNATVEAGDAVDITFQADYMNEWIGYQFTLEFDPTMIEIEEIISGDLPNVYAEENFHIVSQESGLMTVIWNEFGESAHNGKSTLFSLNCTAKTDGEIKDMIYLSSRLTKAEGYTQEGEVSNLTLSFIDSEAIETTESSFELFQNRPNPWNNETIIPFQLNPGGQASLNVYDMAGKLVYKVVNTYTEGYHEVNIRREDLPAIGLFYYTLESGDQKATRKMVLMD